MTKEFIVIEYNYAKFINVNEKAHAIFTKAFYSIEELNDWLIRYNENIVILGIKKDKYESKY
jgi:hypothetical protein